MIIVQIMRNHPFNGRRAAGLLGPNLVKNIYRLNTSSPAQTHSGFFLSARRGDTQSGRQMQKISVSMALDSRLLARCVAAHSQCPSSPPSRSLLAFSTTFRLLCVSTCTVVSRSPKFLPCHPNSASFPCFELHI